MNDLKSRAIGALSRTRRRFTAGFWTRRMMRTLYPVKDGQYAFCFVGSIEAETPGDVPAFRLAHEAFRVAAGTDPMSFNDAHYEAGPVIAKIDEAIKLLETDQVTA